MFKTLRLSFSLRNTYRVNCILYVIKHTPLLKKIIPGTVYQIRGFKIFANILSVIWEIISVFLGKLLYFLLMIVGAASLYKLPVEQSPQMFLHLLVILTFIGTQANTYIFNPTKDKFYAMILLGMNAKNYTLINYFYAIFKVLAGFTLCSFLFGMPAGLSIWHCILIPFFVAGAKITVAAYELWKYEKKGTASNENKLVILTWVIFAVLLAVTYGLPAVGILIPTTVSTVIMIVSVVVGLLAVGKLWTFRYYKPMYKELLVGVTMQMDPSVQMKIQQEASFKTISADSSISSNKKGFEYLNELFIKRHQKILWKSAKKITCGVLVIIVLVILLILFVPEANNKVNGVLMSYLPYFAFIMYMINRGVGFTRALFVNCDHCLLTYSFYKKPKQILKLFQIRLWEIMKINLLPASVIGVGLAFLLYMSGGTDNPLNYVVLIVSIICMSVFFSVHYLTIYYLLQPYNAETQIKSGPYQIVMFLTYMFCYMMIQVKMPTMLFGVMTIVFCVLYCVVASVLVLKLAPKTFRIHS